MSRTFNRLSFQQKSKSSKRFQKNYLQAETKQDSKGGEKGDKWAIDDDNCAYNISGEYCSIDMEGKRLVERSVGEMELQFLQALREFYYDGESQMSNEEFDNLKEELIWSGSRVARLSSDEQRFMEANAAYQAGKPIMTDDEFDDLKGTLRAQSSWVTTQGPRCSIRTKTMYSDAKADYLKMTALNVPSAIIVLLAAYAIDAETDFKITSLIEYPEPWGIIFLWLGLLPLLFLGVTKLTNVVFKDSLILKGNCPNCGESNESYFGDILVIRGSRDKNVLDCKNCKGVLEFNNRTRLIQYDVDATEEKRAQNKKRDEAARKRSAMGKQGSSQEKKEPQKQEQKA